MSNSITLYEEGYQLAESLREEGRGDDAKTVDALLDQINRKEKSLLTTGQVAKKIGVTRQTVVNWIERGWLKGVKIGGRYMISADVLKKADEFNAVFDSLDAERSALTTSEAEIVLDESRKDWTWIGKEE